MNNIQLITGFDIFWSLLVFLVVYFIGKNIEQRKIVNFPYYKYFSKGLIIKVLGGVLFCLIYALYYKGGDTVHYYEGIIAMNKVFVNNPLNFIKILFLDGTDEFTRTCFWHVKTYPPIFMLEDSRTFLVIKLSSILSIPALNGFLATTILLAALVYRWVWKLYEFMAMRYPEYIKEVNWCVLFLPPESQDAVTSAGIRTTEDYNKH